MKAVLDVYYLKDHATAACVIFDHWTDSAPVRIVRSDIPAPEPYRAGRFYLRELPCLLAVLRQAGQPLDTIVIDGYVHLRPGIGKGLGHHLWASLHHTSVVVGVAKNPLQMADRFIPIQRGRSRKPLFISAIGLPLEEAAHSVGSMHGPHRLPTLLKIADQYARGARGGTACPE